MHFVAMSRRSFFLLYTWRHITVVESACWLRMVRDAEKCFMPEAAACETPIRAPPVKNHLAHLAGKSAEKVYLGGIGICFSTFKEISAIVLFSRSDLFFSFFGTNWWCGLKWCGVSNGSLDVGSGDVLEMSSFHKLANPGHLVGQHLVWLVAAVTK